MPNVLILGCTGYIGFAVSQALLRSGNYSVWGTARTPEKAKTLILNEVSPVSIDDITESAIQSMIEANDIDIVVDATSAYEEAGIMLTGVVAASKARMITLANDDFIGPKIGFIYTSGSWVYGSPAKRISDLTPVGTEFARSPPASAVAWRPRHEQRVLAARDVLDVAILRPTEVYGRASWACSVWLTQTGWSTLLPAKNGASTDAIDVPVDAEARIGLVHVDDVAAGYLAAIERIDGRLGSWPVFDLTSETYSVPEIMEAAKKALGVTAPLRYTGTHGDYVLEACSLVFNSEGASRARTVLNWLPKRRDFLANVPIYIKAWEVSRSILSNAKSKS